MYIQIPSTAIIRALMFARLIPAAFKSRLVLRAIWVICLKLRADLANTNVGRAKKLQS